MCWPPHTLKKLTSIDEVLEKEAFGTVGNTVNMPDPKGLV